MTGGVAAVTVSDHRQVELLLGIFTLGGGGGVKGAVTGVWSAGS